MLTKEEFYAIYNRLATVSSNSYISKEKGAFKLFYHVLENSLYSDSLILKKYHYNSISFEKIDIKTYIDEIYPFFQNPKEKSFEALFFSFEFKQIKKIYSLLTPHINVIEKIIDMIKDNITNDYFSHKFTTNLSNLIYDETINLKSIPESYKKELQFIFKKNTQNPKKYVFDNVLKLFISLFRDDSYDKEFLKDNISHFLNIQKTISKNNLKIFDEFKQVISNEDFSAYFIKYTNLSGLIGDNTEAIQNPDVNCFYQTINVQKISVEQKVAVNQLHMIFDFIGAIINKNKNSLLPFSSYSRDNGLIEIAVLSRRTPEAINQLNAIKQLLEQAIPISLEKLRYDAASKKINKTWESIQLKIKLESDIDNALPNAENKTKNINKV